MTTAKRKEYSKQWVKDNPDLVKAKHQRFRQSHPLYARWMSMKRRCEYPKQPKYKDYGERGISVCQEWHVYKAFETWAMENGYSPELEIDRINNDGNYEPSNCRFVTHTENGRNQRTNVLYFGKFTARQLYDANQIICKVKYSNFRERLRNGWDIGKALTTPLQIIYCSRST